MSLPRSQSSPCSVSTVTVQTGLSAGRAALLAILAGNHPDLDALGEAFGASDARELSDPVSVSQPMGGIPESPTLAAAWSATTDVPRDQSDDGRRGAMMRQLAVEADSETGRARIYGAPLERIIVLVDPTRHHKTYTGVQGMLPAAMETGRIIVVDKVVGAVGIYGLGSEVKLEGGKKGPSVGGGGEGGGGRGTREAP
ncbi:hypothetical protein CDD80_4582 [Ophiocordyceps camponoti-rufipedis]|uniref:Uncharacterized protein n=1 Tax=Ophiocordyceps camponoti-rufipedis TaxID=2004952 RepID=A0A2C5YYE1_9HYPO|nr:hypothetical protein CDD80_4582 [Ophiocordyceps camponoti-rufipedis]